MTKPGIQLEPHRQLRSAADLETNNVTVFYNEKMIHYFTRKIKLFDILYCLT